jgi:hypothetical protein
MGRRREEKRRGNCLYVWTNWGNRLGNFYTDKGCRRSFEFSGFSQLRNQTFRGRLTRRNSKDSFDDALDCFVGFD